jgi:hypothetical protein
MSKISPMQSQPLDQHGKDSSMKRILILVGILGFAVGTASGQDTEPVNAPRAFIWKSTPPKDSPFEASLLGTNLYFTGRHANLTQADTWYPSWASDGHLYSPWTDGRIGSENCFSGGGANAKTGQARIEGDDPLDLTVVSLGIHNSSALPYGGRYPCGSLVHDGIWYYGTYGLNGASYGSSYSMRLQEVRLLEPGPTAPGTP